MAIFSIPNIKIAGISACVPRKEVFNIDYKWISLKERQVLIKTTGVEKRRVAEKGTTTSDLCFLAANKLINKLKWERKDIQLLIFVSQSRDFLIPSTSCILQERLGLPKSCIAFDINLGCSGYIYGLSVIGSLISSGNLKKGLLLAGDISSLNCSYRDKSTYPLFGDAGTATAIEYNKQTSDLLFNLQTDGAGYDAIIVPDGGIRNFASKKSFQYKKYSPGIYRNKIQLALNGIDVFNFSLREVVPNVNQLLGYSLKTSDDLDFFVFHQANLLINETLRKKLNIKNEKVPYTIHKFGNTSSASIPLTIVSELREQIQRRSLSLLLSGFGVGLSWGSAIIETNKIVCPEVIEL